MNYQLVPTPKSIAVDITKQLPLNQFVLGNSPLSTEAIDDFISFCKRLDVPASTGTTCNVVFVPEKLPPEAYRLSVDACITIAYGAASGAFYALQTLKQLVLQSDKNVLPYLKIEDAPQYSYRGFMLDVGRYFFPVAEVKKFLDQMALHKLNVFHFHLTEDQGWRIEIKKYPLLTQVGSHRTHTNFGWKPHGGFYTQSEIKEIVTYAHSKYIKVIPEFDIPGHTVSAIACYPYLSCFDRRMKVKTHWGVKHDIMCAGKETTYQFVYDILDELMELFPDGVIHIGGDEAFKSRWKICSHCQAEMKKHHLADPEELQQYFMSKVNAYLEQHNFSSMMWNWDAIEPTEQLNPAIAWNLCGVDEHSARSIEEELQKGRKMVNTNSAAYYLDLPYGWVNLKATADYNPNAFLGHPNMIGVEAALWTEYVPNRKKADYMTYPRLGAFAISAWSPTVACGYEQFVRKLPAYYQLLDCYDVQYATPKQASPTPFFAKCGGTWFNRRQLHWQGLHNLIEDAIIHKKYKQK